MLTARGQKKLDRIVEIQTEIEELEQELQDILDPQDVEEEPAPAKKKYKPREKKINYNEASVPAKTHPWRGGGNPGKSAEIKEDIIAGMKPAAIAAKHDTSVGNVYQIKSIMKKAGELDGAPGKGSKAEEPEEESLAMKQDALTKDQFSEVQDLFKDLGFASEVVDRTGYDADEVKLALNVKNYGMYIFNRKRKG